ncbi:MAG: AI-2E family transporter [Bacteroidales bacterium]|nr:AI-2E family transporter [Bacteroidales bacterium]
MQFNKKTLIGLVVAIAVLGFVFHYLSSLLIYTIVAFVISMLGRPLVQWLNRRFKVPFALGAVIALAVILTFVVGVGWLVFPMFLQQGQALVMMDYGQLTSDTSTGFRQLTAWLSDKGIHISETEVKSYILAGVQQLVQMISLRDIIANTAGFLTSFGMGLFASCSSPFSS